MADRNDFENGLRDMLTAVESGARASDGLEQRLAAIDGSAGHASQPRVGPHRAIGRRSPRWVPPLLAAAVLAVIAGGAAVVSTVAADHSRPATRPPTLTPTPTPVPTPITTPAPRPSTAVTTARTTSSTTAPTGSPTSASSSPAGSRTAAVTLGPLGFGTLKLGMNAQQARLTGEISSLTDIPGGCSRFDLKAITTRPAGGIDGYIDLKYGVVFIAAPPGVQTPQGIGVGSTLAAVRAAYPDLIEGQGGPKVAVPGNPAAFYAFVYDRSTRIIVGMDLVTAGPQSCYG